MTATWVREAIPAHQTVSAVSGAKVLPGVKSKRVSSRLHQRKRLTAGPVGWKLGVSRPRWPGWKNWLLGREAPRHMNKTTPHRRQSEPNWATAGSVTARNRHARDIARQGQ
jgi:hypothetical protein